MNVVLFGGRGQLGTALRAVLAADAVEAPAREAVDVLQEDAAALICERRPDVVINCTAFHNVDLCEREPEPAFATNAIAVDRMARACAAVGSVFVTISTDYVFAGDLGRAYDEADRPAPRTVYGTSKLAGEVLVRRHGPRHLIVRTSAVFGTIGTSSKGYTLIDKVLAQAERGEPTRMVDDMTFSPSFAPHVARAIRQLLEREAFGTHHVTNAGQCTWYEFVRTAFAKAGLAHAALEPTAYASLGNATQRPMYSPLHNSTFAHVAVPPLPAWQQALDEFLTARRDRLAAVRS
jgi:dTDP-4-dehydrorhamnose reductase